MITTEQTQVGSVGSDRRAAPLKLLIVAGEASGDLHGASLLEQLHRQVDGVEVCGVGGDLMAAQGADLLYHYRKLAVVGITEVLAHLGDVRRAMKRLVDAAVARQVDAVVLIDYPDFNMTLARRLRRVRPDLRIVYYVSPQVWAWRAGRVRTLARLVDRMLVILPFERQLYEDAGVPVDFVGHPLLDVIPPPGDRKALAQRHGLDADREWIGLLPGSRRTEVERLLPEMLGAAEKLLEQRSCQFVVPRASALEAETYERCLSAITPRLRERVRLVDRDYYELLGRCRGAVVCSGTATLETAMVGTPEVVVYKASWLTYKLGKWLVRIHSIALVNVIAGHRGVPELLQGDVNPARIVEELLPLLGEGKEREGCLRFLAQVRERLGDAGASERAARAVLAVAGSPRGGSGATRNIAAVSS